MSAEDVRELLIDELDPMSGACAVVIAQLLDAPKTPPATSEDLLAVVGNAMDSGRVPIGPLEYASEEVDYGVRTHLPVATIAVHTGAEVTLRLALALSDGDCLGVGGNRYGYQRGDRVSPWTVLLPDVEAGFAELIVYVDERAAQLNYRGRVRATLELISAAPVRPGIIDSETGRIALGEPLEDFTPLTIEYSVDMSQVQIDALVYAAAQEVATRFGADEPQFLTRP